MHEAQCIAGIALLLWSARHRSNHGAQDRCRLTGDHIIHACATAAYRQGHPVQRQDARAKSRYAYIAKEVLHLAGETEDELVAASSGDRHLNDKLDIPQGIKNYSKGGV